MENLVEHGVGHCGLRERVVMRNVAWVTVNSDPYDCQRKEREGDAPLATTDQHANISIQFTYF